jgi:hypothetical protein
MWDFLCYCLLGLGFYAACWFIGECIDRVEVRQEQRQQQHDEVMRRLKALSYSDDPAA